MNNEILCVGEVLWDVFPTGRHLGGAPLNVACQLRALGHRVALASRVGDDLLGREILQQLMDRNIATDLLQTDPELPTGQVQVMFNGPDAPNYDIVAPASWDAIEMTPALILRAKQARAIVFGSLAQRDQRSRHAIRSLLDSEALRVFDVNLRPPYDQRHVVEESLCRSDMVKLNCHELDRMRQWFDLPRDMQEAVIALTKKFSCQTVCVTRGARGAALFHGNQWFHHDGYRVEVVDTVGAGDAFLAALLGGLLRDRLAAEAVEFASAVSAYVVTRLGATPFLDIESIGAIQSGCFVEPRL